MRLELEGRGGSWRGGVGLGHALKAGVEGCFRRGGVELEGEGVWSWMRGVFSEGGVKLEGGVWSCRGGTVLGGVHWTRYWKLWW